MASLQGGGVEGEGVLAAPVHVEVVAAGYESVRPGDVPQLAGLQPHQDPVHPGQAPVRARNIDGGDVGGEEVLQLDDLDDVSLPTLLSLAPLQLQPDISESSLAALENSLVVVVPEYGQRGADVVGEADRDGDVLGEGFNPVRDTDGQGGQPLRCLGPLLSCFCSS